MHRVIQRLTQQFIQSSRNKSNKRLASCTITLLLLLASPAWAGYTPPSQPSAPRGGNTTTTGRRGGCQGNESDALTVLAPASHVGQTASTHPTFAWFVPDTASIPIEFHLFSDSGKIIYKTQLQSSPGMMSLALPETEPALQVGQGYRWQVTLLCNPNRPSSAIVSRAEIKVVPLPASLGTSLKSVTDPTAQADLLAEAGLWYDAFATVAAQRNASLQTARQALLTSLAEVEATHGQNSRSAQLRQIAAAIGVR